VAPARTAHWHDNSSRPSGSGKAIDVVYVRGVLPLLQSGEQLELDG